MLLLVNDYEAYYEIISQKDALVLTIAKTKEQPLNFSLLNRCFKCWFHN